MEKHQYGYDDRKCNVGNHPCFKDYFIITFDNIQVSITHKCICKKYVGK